MAIMAVTALGSRIRELRERRGWTQGQLAAYARVGRSWLSLVESGDRENPNAHDLLRVARTLGVSVEYLLTGESGSDDPATSALLGQMRAYPRAAIERALATLALWAGEYRLEPRVQPGAEQEAEAERAGDQADEP